ncbi:response regulator [Prosthecobacter sp.]|uniref:hybrid sensor histidine kinase/response regulator n=1 Tax=Prosthecobacter sp. TaxID=1965333 RepID=UPI003783D065
MNNDLDLPKRPQHGVLKLDPCPVEGAKEEKEAFLGNMGHELRNPLSNIIAQVETLLEGIYGPLEPAQKAALMAVEASTRQMLQLVADVVDLGKIDAGGVPLTLAPCRVSEICGSSMATVAELARARSIQTASEVVPEDLTVMADAPRLQQIITELLSAAVLSMPTGGRLQLRSTQDAGVLLLQTLSSTSPFQVETSKAAAGGPAPPAELVRRLSKVKPIGLALLQKLVRLHGGSFEVSETPQQEISMLVCLPLADETDAAPVPETGNHERVHSEHPAAAAAASSTQPTILIADDQAALLTVTRNYLESLGFTVITARDGSEAVQQAVTVRPDLILMDVRMPVVDGLSAIRQIRAAEDPKTRAISIVSLSGHASAADKERCLAAGATGYLNKPFGVRELDRIIAEHIRADCN